MMDLFDTHCHLDASEFEHDRDAVMQRARACGVRGVLIPAVDVAGFERVRALAHQIPEGAYAIGIHPMYVQHTCESDLQRMQSFIETHRSDPRLVAVGEIGLDFFVQAIADGDQRVRQIHFYRQQLRFALEFDLPVLLHVRRSQDELLKWLRREGSPGGIAHAFNGSAQQAEQFLGLGFALGVGGAMTFSRALQIRRLAKELSLDGLVLETDGPDIAPAWLEKGQRNEPAEVLGVAQALASLREVEIQTVIAQTAQTARRVIPRLGRIW